MTSIIRGPIPQAGQEQRYNFAPVVALVVDPNPRLQELYRQILEGLGFGAVHCVGDANAAAQVLAEHPVNLVMIELFDLEEKPTGLSLLKHFRKLPNQRHATLPIAMTCSRVTQLQVHAARSAGADEFISKPFSVESLFRSLVRRDGGKTGKPGTDSVGDRMRDLISRGTGNTAGELIKRAREKLAQVRESYEADTAAVAAEIAASLSWLQSASAEDRPRAVGKIRRHAIRLQEESLLHDYQLVDAIAGSLAIWCDQHAGHPRLGRAVKAHAAALQTVITGKLRGDRPTERAALLAALTADLFVAEEV